MVLRIPLESQTDWTNWDSIAALKDSCTDLGYEIDDNLITQMQQATGAVKDFDSTAFCEELANIVKIVQELETGDTISAEDYQQLGAEYSDFFMLMADGTYKLVGDAEAFRDAVMEATTGDLVDKMEEIKSTKAQLQEQYDAATEAMGNYSLETLQTDQFHAYEDSSNDQGYGGWYSGDTVKTQVDFLEQMGYNADKIQAWRDDLENNNTTTTDNRKLQNGSFEEGQTFTKDYLQPDQKDVPSWNTTAFQGKIELFKVNTGTYIPSVTLKPTDGSIAAELNADEESTLYQNVKTTFPL